MKKLPQCCGRPCESLFLFHQMLQHSLSFPRVPTSQSYFRRWEKTFLFFFYSFHICFVDNVFIFQQPLFLFFQLLLFLQFLLSFRSSLESLLILHLCHMLKYVDFLPRKKKHLKGNLVPVEERDKNNSKNSSLNPLLFSWIEERKTCYTLLSQKKEGVQAWNICVDYQNLGTSRQHKKLPIFVIQEPKDI